MIAPERYFKTGSIVNSVGMAIHRRARAMGERRVKSMIHFGHVLVAELDDGIQVI
jgi:hypothetical protein